MTITGTGFREGATVTIGGLAATNVTVVSSVWLTATTPPHPTGAVDVAVATAEGRTVTTVTLAGRFHYFNADSCVGPWDY